MQSADSGLTAAVCPPADSTAAGSKIDAKRQRIAVKSVQWLQRSRVRLEEATAMLREDQERLRTTAEQDRSFIAAEHERLAREVEVQRRVSMEQQASRDLYLVRLTQLAAKDVVAACVNDEIEHDMASKAERERS